MSKAQDLMGKQFNGWTVINREKNYIRKNGKVGDAVWKCRCSCGKKQKVRAFQLRTGRSKQCLKCTYKATGLKHRCFHDTNNVNQVFWKRINKGAKDRNIPCLLTMDELQTLFEKQDKKCALTRLPLFFPSKHDMADGTASLDRIDSEKPYILDNVQWVHKDINIMKHVFTEPYFIKMCGLVHRTKKGIK
jgi:hypothetical protein